MNGRTGGACVLALWFALTAAPAPAQSPPAAPLAGQPVQLDRNGVLILVRTTMIALDQANRTGNYTVLRDLGAPAFQTANTAARLAEIFANLRAQSLDLSGAAVLDPQLTLLPQLEPNGLMRMSGFFPSFPLQINFDLLFAAVEGRWLPFGISIGVAQSSPSAPAAGAAAPAPAPPASASAAPKPGPPRPAAAGRPAQPAQPSAPRP